MTSPNLGFPLAADHLWERYLAARDGHDQPLMIAYLELLLSGTINRLLSVTDNEATHGELLRERGERVVRERTNAEIDTLQLPEFDLPPFVRHVAPDRRDVTAFDWWCVEPSGDAAADIKRGTEYFHAAVALDRVLAERSGREILPLVSGALLSTIRGA